jgi:predicted secreted protein
MDWFTGAMVFILVWWTAIFCVLPWGLQRDERGLPVNLDFKKKLLYTTTLAAMIWLVVYALVESDMISFHDMAFTIAEKDRLT